MANIIDFLQDYKHICQVNSRISFMYIFYTLINFLGSLLGPSIILLGLINAFRSTFGK